jgi:hypothetical protein
MTQTWDTAIRSDMESPGGALAEMYVQGVSTRKVKAITEELCGHEFSSATVSRINESLDGGLVSSPSADWRKSIRIWCWMRATRRCGRTG